MPGIQPGQAIAPGVAPSTAGYPQYGVGGGTPGSSAGWKVVTAHNNQEKMQYAQQGFLVWFSSKSAAQNFISSESSTVGSGNVPSTGIFAPLAEIGDFFHRLTEGETWVRVGEVALGGIIVYAALRGLTRGSSTVGAGARSKITKPVSKVAKGVATVAVPEARVAYRAGAKRVAPKTTARVAAHREHVAKYGQKKPYKPPAPKPPRVTYRVSTITHVRANAPKPKPKPTPEHEVGARLIAANKRARKGPAFKP